MQSSPTTPPAPQSAEIATSGVWDLSCSANVFLPDGKKVPFFGGSSSSSPVPIQVTQFDCGGVAVGIRIAHPLADAQTLSVFMKRWSFEHLILFLSESALDGVSTPETELPGPVLSRQLLDSQAAGDISALSPDETILAKPRALPSSRYDWFYPASDGDPDRSLPTGITRSMIKSPGTPMPKEDWDTNSPSIPYQTSFLCTADEKDLGGCWRAGSGC
ncbi:hypothetical protein BDW75DRAFT_235799 [Aspergillus navahoensis]